MCSLASTGPEACAVSLGNIRGNCDDLVSMVSSSYEWLMMVIDDN